METKTPSYHQPASEFLPSGGWTRPESPVSAIVVQVPDLDTVNRCFTGSQALLFQPVVLCVCVNVSVPRLSLERLLDWQSGVLVYCLWLKPSVWWSLL